MLQESQINVDSTEKKLLFDIRELLKEQNELLKKVGEANVQQQLSPSKALSSVSASSKHKRPSAK